MASTENIRIKLLKTLILMNYFVIGYVNSSNSQGKEELSCRWCGLSDRQKIIGGRDAQVHEFPWLVTVRYWKVRICGGTIINARYILTAAHCINGRILALLTVAASVVDVLNTREISFAVADTVGHDRFDRDTYDYDIALVRLAKPIKFGKLRLRPVCLRPAAANQDFSGRLATVVGWGTVQEDEDAPPTTAKLHKVALPIVANDVCRNASGLREHLITPRMMCAGYIAGGKDACQGDSGGPIMIREKVDGNVWNQVGIVSWGVGCGKPNYYGVYTRISYFTKWLTANMWDWTC